MAWDTEMALAIKNTARKAAKSLPKGLSLIHIYKSFTHKQYSDLSAAQADENLYTADNYNAICDLLGFAPYQMHVFRADSDGALADTLTEISKTVKTGWLTIAGQSAADGLALSAWVKTQDNTKKKTYKAVCYGLTTCLLYTSRCV